MEMDALKSPSASFVAKEPVIDQAAPLSWHPVVRQLLFIYFTDYPILHHSILIKKICLLCAWRAWVTEKM